MGVRRTRAQIDKWQPNYYNLEVSYEMFTANMQPFMMDIICIESQIMPIFRDWIWNTQYAFQKWWYKYMKWYLSHKHHSAVWLSWVNHNTIFMSQIAIW